MRSQEGVNAACQCLLSMQQPRCRSFFFKLTLLTVEALIILSQLIRIILVKKLQLIHLTIDRTLITT